MKRIEIICGIAVLLCACSVKEEALTSDAAAAEETQVLEEDAGVVAGVTVVQLSDELTGIVEADLLSGSLQTKSTGLNGVLEELGIVSAVPVFPEEECPEEFRARERKAGLRNFFYVTFDPQKTPVTKAAEAFSSLPGIISAEPVYQTALKDGFNDPMLGTQWHYINQNNPGCDVNCKPLWDKGIVGSPDVIVSVVDEGVDLAHPDLAWNCIPGGKNGSFNFANGSVNVDPMSHGTHVAGTIAAVNNNGKGVSGIAGGDYKAGKQGVKIMSCQFFGTKSNGSSANAIRWGANHGAVISQNSWGYVIDLDHNGSISTSELERGKNIRINSSDRAAVDYFTNYAGCDADGNQLPDSPMKGGIVIFAAGNDNISYGPPSNYERILSVGAINQSGKKAAFSNYGDWVDICAPGASILSTMPNNQYGSMSGTSMACPHVSGVAALIISACGGPGFSNDMLWAKLVNGANPDMVNSGKNNIGPLVDAYGAYVYGSNADPVAVDSYTAAVQSNNVSFEWTLNANSEGEPNYAAMLYASKDRNLLEKMDPSKPGKGIIASNVLTATKGIGEKVGGTLHGLEFETEYFVTMAVYSYGRKFTPLAPIQSITTSKNNPPYVTIDPYPVPTHKNYEIWTVHIDADDPDGHEVDVKYESGSDADAVSPDAENGGFMIVVNGPRAAGGTYTGKVIVTDAYGLSATQDFTYTLTENAPPVIVKQPENVMLSGPGEQVSFPTGEIFFDEDGENLAITIDNSDNSVAHVVSSEGKLIVSALRYGVSVITITASDAKKESVSAKFTVLIREPSVEINTYPTQVETVLYISTGMTLEDTHISLYSSGGSLLYENTVKSSAFEPAAIDMSGYAPGRYGLVVDYAGKQYKRTVVKK